LLLLLLLLLMVNLNAFIQNCPCSAIAKSSSACPFDRDCDNSRVIDYRTGIPWRSADFLECVDGRHRPSTGSTLAASVAAVACVKPTKCANCSPLKFDEYCHPDFVCRGEALQMTQSDDGCSVASCAWGDLMVIDTVLPTAAAATPPIPTAPTILPTPTTTIVVKTNRFAIANYFPQ
ncbi:hypothetical protein PFISCL1PPCAC_18651, partial [Pristionchus fissidentatus]